MIQVYTGNGKGKTTAAIGLAVRASGAGMKVYIAQFCKGRFYSEIKALKNIKRIKIEQFGRSCFISRAPQEADRRLALKGLEKARKAITCGEYNLVVLDEINIAVKFKLISLQDLLELIGDIPGKVEVVLTGRYAHPKLKSFADLFSRVEEVKHYYNRGVKARKGIEF